MHRYLHTLAMPKKFFAEKKPIGQVKYASKQKNDWKKLVEVYEACTEFDRFKRPEIKRVLDLLNANSTSQPTFTASEDAKLSEEFHLRVCQSTVIENVDGFVAVVAPIPIHIFEMMAIDGTNACVFLCLKLAHELLSKDCLSSSSNITQLAEDIIEKILRVI